MTILPAHSPLLQLEIRGEPDAYVEERDHRHSADRASAGVLRKLCDVSTSAAATALAVSYF